MAYALPRDPTNVMGRRIMAYLLDAILAGAVMFAFLAATNHRVFTNVPPNQCKVLRSAGFHGQCLQLGSRLFTWRGHGLTIGWFVGVVVSFVDNVVVQGVTGASIGKMIVGLRVIDDNGAIAHMGRAFVRWLLLIIDAGIFFAGLLIAFLTHPHRRVGDMAGGTYVIAAADVGTPMRPVHSVPATPSTWGMAAQTQPPPWGAPPTPASTAPPPGDQGEPRDSV